VAGPEAHSKHSASNFEANTLCPGRPVMMKGLPDSSSQYADEGTAAHTLLGWCIDNDRPALAFKGRRIPVGMRTFEVNDDMCTAVQTAVDNIKAIAADGMVLSEQKVTYADYLGVPREEAWGTSDIIAARGDELQVHDYKHGRGVEVDADDNPQMKLYALGALDAVEDTLGPFTTVRLVIHQPRIKDAPSEWTMTVDELKAWGRGEARRSVEEQDGAERMHARDTLTNAEWEAIYLRPNEKSCKFCKAKATCPALRGAALEPVFAKAPASVDEFDDLAVPTKAHIAPATDDWLAAAMAKADLIEDWLKAVRAEVERRLLAGGQVPGFKIVQGRQGNRAWSDKAAVEAALKAMRLKVEEMYDLTLISPTTAEKLAKAKTIGPRQWKTLQEQITRSEGAKHVAPENDPRPALVLTPAEDDFDTVSTATPVDEFDFA
jgi:hypothetical protein